MPRELTYALRELQTTSGKSVRALYGGQNKAYQRARVNLVQGHRMDRATAKELYAYFDNAANEYASHFFTSDKQDAIYVEVEAIERGFAEVYDLSVPGSHTFIANGLGNHNTCNFPATATEEDVAQAYLLGWKLGCKGLTVYVTGSREKVVLETKETLEKKKQKEQEVIPAEPPKLEQVRMFNEDKKPRPRHLSGQTYRIETPAGTTYVTINENGEGPGHPFEVFIHTGKVGSEVMAIAEATGRLVSYLLRLVSPVSPNKRLQEIARQLRGIGGDTSLGFGPNRVRSLPDGLAQVFEEYLLEREEARREAEEKSTPPNAPLQKPLLPEIKSNGSSKHSHPPLGDLCPECGSATLVYEEGCQKCYSCGFSKC